MIYELYKYFTISVIACIVDVELTYKIYPCNTFTTFNKTYIYISSSACTGYTNLSDPWRNVGFCSSSCRESDTNLTQGWYRFTGIGGDELISSCAHVLNKTSGNETVYNLFTCNSDMNDTMYMTCSEGFTVYELRPTKKSYTTREKSFACAS